MHFTNPSNITYIGLLSLYFHMPSLTCKPSLPPYLLSPIRTLNFICRVLITKQGVFVILLEFRGSHKGKENAQKRCMMDMDMHFFFSFHLLLWLFFGLFLVDVWAVFWMMFMFVQLFVCLLCWKWICSVCEYVLSLVPPTKKSIMSNEAGQWEDKDADVE